MSLLMFAHEPTSALILTDTLATTQAGEPFLFHSKSWVIPHMNMAMAVTGIANFGGAWNELLCNSLLARDIDMVDQFAPEQLRRVWSELLGRKGFPEGATSTIYHFGFPEDSERLVRYVYRSEADFASERWEDPGFGIKPYPRGEFEVPADLHAWVDLAERVRAEQDVRPAGERVFIGGELFLVVLQSWNSQIVRVHRFDHYDQAWLDMNARLHQEQGE